MEKSKSKIESKSESKNEPKKWIEIERSIILEKPPARTNNTYTRNLSIDEDFSELTPEELNKLLVPPLDHQKKLIRAMLDVEKTQSIKIKSKDSTFIVQSRACILSDKPGSGKSYSIIAVILLNRKLPLGPIFLQDDQFYYSNNTVISSSETINNILLTPKTILPVNIIFVSKNVMDQWREYIERFSEGLGIVLIDKFNVAKKVIEEFAKNKKYFAHTNIILVKNDKINSKKGKINHPALADTSMENKSMVEIFSQLINGSNLIVERVILDDFDSLMIPATTKIIPAKFTWFVSATKGKYRHTEEPNVYNNILENTVLSTYFNLNTDPYLLNMSIKFCDVQVRQYQVQDAVSRYRNGIVQLNPNLSELINSGSLSEIGNRLKITKETVTIYEIFQKMYEKEYHSYRSIKILHQRLLRIEKYYRTVLSHKPKNKLSPEVIEFLKSLISKGKDAELVLKWTDYSNEVLEKYIDTVLATAEKNLNQKTLAIKRVISNFQEGTCPITLEELKNGDVYVMKCCGITLSKEGIEAIRNDLCPTCRAPVRQDNIFILEPNGFGIVIDETEDIEEIAEDQETQDNKTTNLLSNDLDVDDLIGLMSGSITAEIPYNSREIKELVANKQNAVLKLITQDDPNLQQVGYHYKVFGGGEYAKLENKKFIIFASSSSSIKMMLYENPDDRKNGDVFTKNNISYAEIKGMRTNIVEKIKRFRLPNSHSGSIKVLIITSKSRAFAGLDLQCTTDIIFLNKIKDPNIEKQMIGRALRLGRANKLDIHYLSYQNEVFDTNELSDYF